MVTDLTLRLSVDLYEQLRIVAKVQQKAIVDVVRDAIDARLREAKR